MDVKQRKRAYDAVDQATDLPMLLLSLVLVPIIVVPLLTTIPKSWEAPWQTVGWVIWAAFALELTVKLYLAPQRLRYLRDHWFDVLIVVVPLLRPLRAFHVLRVLRPLLLVRLVGIGAKVGNLTYELLGRRGMPYALLVGGLLILASTVAVMFAERGHGGTINDFGSALWWAMATATTVGYGDVAPVTPAGRGIAVFIMCIGITLFGLFTANAATFLIQSAGRPEGRKEVTLADLADQIHRLEEQVAELRDALTNQTGAAAAPEPNGVDEAQRGFYRAGSRQ